MNIIAELSELWSGKNLSNPIIPDGFVANPLPYFEAAWLYVHSRFLQECNIRNCTFAELLDEIKMLESDAVESYFQLLDRIDCDVYGKWCSGELTGEERNVFCALVDDWKQTVVRMIQLLHNGDAHGRE